MNPIDRALKDIAGQLGPMSARVKQLERSWFASVKQIHSETDPEIGHDGDVVINTYDNTIKMYSGGNWILLSYGAGDIPNPPEHLVSGVSGSSYTLSWSPPSSRGDLVKEYVIFSDSSEFGSSKQERLRTASNSANLDFIGDAYFWVASVGHSGLLSTLVSTGLVVGNARTPSVYFVTAVEFGGYKLNWEAVPGAVKYEVESSMSSNGLNNESVWIGDTLFTPVIKKPGMAFFRIRSIAGDGTMSEWTEWTADERNPPQPVATVASNFEYVTISISPDDTSHSSAGFAHYRIRRADDEFGSVNVTTVDEAAEFSEFPCVIPQTPGTSMYYELTPYDWANNPGTATAWLIGISMIILGWSSHSISDDGHHVSWTHFNPAIVDNYVIYRNTTPSSSGASIVANINPPSTSYIIPFGAGAYFGIKAVYNDASETEIYWTANNDPAVTVPTGVVANLSEIGGWIVSWDSVNFAKRYEVQGNTLAQESGATTLWSGDALKTPTLRSGDKKYWRVRTVGYTGNSAWSSWDTDIIAPPTPSIVVINTATHATISLASNDTSHTSVGFKDYKLERANDAAGTGATTIATGVVASMLPYQVTQPSRVNYWRLTPYDLAGNAGTASAWTAGTLVTTLAWASHSYVDSGNDVTWAHNRPDLVNYYALYRNSTGVDAGATFIANVSAPAYGYVIPYAATTYFGVKAVYLDGVSSAIVWSPQYLPSVATPTGVAAAMSEINGWTVGWTTVTNAIRYEVQGNTLAQESGATTIWTGDATVTPPLSNLSKKYWRVRAIGRVANSAYSSWVTASASFSAPVITVWDTPGYANVGIASTDTTHAVAGFKHYIVQRATDSSGTGATTLDAARPYAGFPFQVAQATLSTKYYRLIPVDLAGNQGTATAWTAVTVSAGEGGFKDYFDGYGGDAISDLDSLYWLKLEQFENASDWGVNKGSATISNNATYSIDGSNGVKFASTTYFYAIKMVSLDLSSDGRFTDDDYIVISYYLTGIATSVRVLFYTDLGGLFGSFFQTEGLPVSAGWNFGKVKKSDISEYTEGGLATPDWSNIIRIGLQVSAPSTIDAIFDDLRIVKADPADDATYNDTGKVWNFATTSGSTHWHIYEGNRAGEPAKPFSLGNINEESKWQMAYVDGLDVSTGTVQVGVYQKTSGWAGFSFFVKDATPASWDMYSVLVVGSTIYLSKWVNASATTLTTATFTNSLNTLVWLGVDLREFESDPGRIKVYVSTTEGNLIQARNLVISHKHATPLPSGGSAGVLTHSSNARFVNFSAGSPAHAEVADVARALDGPIISGISSRLWLRNNGGSVEKSTNGVDYTEVSSGAYYASYYISADVNFTGWVLSKITALSQMEPSNIPFASGDFTVPVSGYYLVIAQISFDLGTAGDVCIASIGATYASLGVTYQHSTCRAIMSSTNTVIGVQTSAKLQLSAGDKISLFGGHSRTINNAIHYNSGDFSFIKILRLRAI